MLKNGHQHSCNHSLSRNTNAKGEKSGPRWGMIENPSMTESPVVSEVVRIEVSAW